MLSLDHAVLLWRVWVGEPLVNTLVSQEISESGASELPTSIIWIHLIRKVKLCSMNLHSQINCLMKCDFSFSGTNHENWEKSSTTGVGP